MLASRTIAVTVLLGVIGGPGWVSGDALDSPSEDGSVQVGGGWSAGDEVVPHAQRWQIDAVRQDDGSLRGGIAVENSPLLRTGTIDGRVSGSTVNGRILNETGTEVATFAGIVTEAGMSGTYKDRTGEGGEWVWDGRPTSP